jgi:hypothetical protein
MAERVWPVGFVQGIPFCNAKLSKRPRHPKPEGRNMKLAVP